MLLPNRFQPLAYPPASGFPHTLDAVRASQDRWMKMALRTVSKLNKPKKRAVAFGVDLRNMKKGDHATLITRLATRAYMAGAVVDRPQAQPKRPLTWYEAER